jgi:predicted nucleic acid-binding protein
MKALIDNNVIIDALRPNAAFAPQAQEILRRASGKEIDAFVSANSLTDIFYVLRKEHGGGKARAMIRMLLLLLDIAGVEPEDCVNALELPMTDFEDALVSVCAAKISADCIVTRDEGFLRAASPVKTISPGEFLAGLAIS